MQGEAHFRLIQALLNGHSLFTTHSGRHDGGLPTNSGKQEHIAAPLLSLQRELGPHGFGLQASTISTGANGEYAVRITIQ